MNDYIQVGKIVNTFGIRGELKVDSVFEYKDRIFQENFPLYIGISKTKELIESHRVHKNYDMLLFKGYNNINEVLKYKGEYVYILREDLKLKDNEYLLSDLVGFKVYEENNLLGIVIDYEINNVATYVRVKGEKSFLIPLNDIYIKDILVKDKMIMTNKGSELIL